MNTCQCCKCKGTKGHYSDYYHREEGFDGMYNHMVRYFQGEIGALKAKMRAHEADELLKYRYQDS